MTATKRLELGTFGIWRDRHTVASDEYKLVEDLGFRSLWLGNGPTDDLDIVEEALRSTERLVVATSALAMGRISGSALASSYHRIQAKYPDRLLLGVSVGRRPLSELGPFLDNLVDAGVPRERIIVGSLGKASMRIAAERTTGAHPYLTTVEHTRAARDWLGENALLAPEVHLVFDDAPEAVAAAEESLTTHLTYPAYRRMYKTLGYDHEIEGRGSERLRRDVIISGDDHEVVSRLRALHTAGADHVAVQIFERSDVSIEQQYQRLADALRSASAAGSREGTPRAV